MQSNGDGDNKGQLSGPNASTFSTTNAISNLPQDPFNSPSSTSLSIDNQNHKDSNSKQGNLQTSKASASLHGSDEQLGSASLPVILEYHSLQRVEQSKSAIASDLQKEALIENASKSSSFTSEEAVTPENTLPCNTEVSVENSSEFQKDVEIKTEIEDDSWDVKHCNVVLSPLRDSPMNIKKIKQEPQDSVEEISDKMSMEPSKFKCAFCDFTTEWKLALFRHRRIHTKHHSFRSTVVNQDIESVTQIAQKDSDEKSGLPPSLLNCLLCEFVAHSKEELTDHVTTYHQDSDGTLKCSFCDYSTTDEHEYRDHISTHPADSEITNYTCQLCTFSSTTKYDLAVHNLVHKGGKGFQCSECSYSTTHKHSLISHRRIHTGEKPFRCLYCDYSSRQKPSLVLHQKKQHAKSKLFKCSQCPFRSGRKSHFDDHVMSEHPEGDGPFQCPKCPEILENKESYTQHMEAHGPPDKIWRCTVCLYSTRNKNTFSLHIRHHRNRKRLKQPSLSEELTDMAVEECSTTGDNRLQCSRCPFATPHKAVLKVHMRRHTGEKPYTCHLCEYRSAQAGNLDSHLKNHSVRRMFSCPYCTYSVSYEANLEKHINRDHVSLNLGERSNNENNYLDNSEQDKIYDGEEGINPIEQMCQVTLDEPSTSVQYQNSDGDTNEDESLTPPVPLKPFKLRTVPPGYDPYVTLMQGLYRCNECFYSTREKEKMDSHQQTHVEEKRYCCSYCDYRCARPHHLKRHEMKYKGGDPIKCKYCSYRMCAVNFRHIKLCYTFSEMYDGSDNYLLENDLLDKSESYFETFQLDMLSPNSGSEDQMFLETPTLDGSLLPSILQENGLVEGSLLNPNLPSTSRSAELQSALENLKTEDDVSHSTEKALTVVNGDAKTLMSDEKLKEDYSIASVTSKAFESTVDTVTAESSSSGTNELRSSLVENNKKNECVQDIEAEQSDMKKTAVAKEVEHKVTEEKKDDKKKENVENIGAQHTENKISADGNEVEQAGTEEDSACAILHERESKKSATETTERCSEPQTQD